ncbi:MAG: fasciclin domain-containing protein [Chthonomonadales bacterium]
MLGAFAAPRAHADDIVDVAVKAGSFKTLVAAVKAAGLVDALKGPGPLTVFAPTDDAFKALEKKKPGTIAMLLKPENKETLKSILLYHVVKGKVTAADVMKLKSGTKVEALSGAKITIGVSKHGVMLNKHVKVIKTDIEASNGVIHVINAVLMPPAKM